MKHWMIGSEAAYEKPRLVDGVVGNDTYHARVATSCGA